MCVNQPGVFYSHYVEDELQYLGLTVTNTRSDYMIIVVLMSGPCFGISEYMH